jgi:enoyl-[acyl-carrier protein] reductase II
VIKNKMSRQYLEMAKNGNVSLEEIEKLTLGSLSKAVFDGDMSMGSIMAGQSAGLVKEIKPVADILSHIFEPSLVAKGVF